MIASTCTTHHDACECRQAAMEAEIDRLQAESDLARAKLAEWEDNAASPGEPCPTCGGQGRYEEGTGYESDDGGEMTRVLDCADCGGQGLVRPTEASDASTNAFDAIAVLCGCPTWEYPGQIVRDVEALVKERDEARAAHREVVEDTARKVALAVAEAVPRAREQGAREMRRLCADAVEHLLDRQGVRRDADPEVEALLSEIEAIDSTSTRPALDVWSAKGDPRE